MARQNRCSNRGAVVGSDGRVPIDPTEHRGPRVVAAVGCGRLRCSKCKAMVRHRAEVGLTEPIAARGDALYDTDDWLTLTYVAATSVGRLYACRCAVHRELQTTLIDDPDFDPTEGDVKLPWRCAGHPRAKPPIDVDGVTLGETEDFVELLAATARGEVPSDAHRSQRVAPIQWLHRLRNRIAGSPLAPRLEEAMAESLRSEDDQQVAQALMYFDVVPDSSGFPSALKAMKRVERRPYLDCKGRPQYAFRTLLSRISQPGAAPDDLDPQVVQLVQSLALHAETHLDERIVRGLVQLDPVWASNHCAELTAGRAGLATSLLDSLFVVDRQDLIVVAGTRLAHDADAPARAELSAWVTEGYHSVRGYAAVLRQLLAGAEA